ncbi:NAD(P)H-dependent oxidoreductase [Kordiimonas sp.]|uniref:NAD(P)H-dependent oxidoreductase n=1 Tax=Kordiimonas sp. TaxID=1970157 RepID=UPI003B51E061
MITKTIVILQGHPDHKEQHLCHTLATHYREAAEATGHQETCVDVGALDFPLLTSKVEWETGDTPATLLAAQDAILQAKHLVIIYPLWLGSMPAKLKGFLEQALRPSLTARAASPTKWRSLLKGCSARVIVTMGMPGIAYRVFYLSQGLKVLCRNILAFSGVAPIRTTVVGMVEKKQIVT